MMNDVPVTSKTSKIDLDPEWWLENSQDVIAKIQSHIDEGVAIDASAPSAVSAQVAQLLVVVKQSADAKEVPFRLHNPSEAVIRSLSTLGLLETLTEDTQ